MSEGKTLDNLLFEKDALNKEIEILNKKLETSIRNIEIAKNQMRVSKSEKELFLKIKKWDVVNINGRMWFVNGDLKERFNPDYNIALKSLVKKGIIEQIN